MSARKDGEVERLLLEHEWKAFLAGAGVAVPRGVFLPYRESPSYDLGDLAALRPPLAVKVLGPSIIHKSEMGAVRLGVRDTRELPALVDDMVATVRDRGGAPVSGVLVEEMALPGVELVLGVLTDGAFGKLLAFGAGGILVEALGRVQYFTLPLRPFDVDTILDSAPWLAPTLRRLGEGGLVGLRELIWRFGGADGIALDPRVARLEMNPVVVSGAGAVAVDARGAMVRS